MFGTHCDRHVFLYIGLALLASCAAVATLTGRLLCTHPVRWLVHKRTQELDALNRILMRDISERTALASQLQTSRSHLRELVEHKLLVKEEERKRIAREIHDELGQSLIALKMQLSVMASQCDASQTRDMGNALARIDDTIQAMRLIVNELRPAVLDLGLDAAIEWEVAKFSRRTGILATLELCQIPDGLPEHVVTALYRIAQESLTNVIKHARASEVKIALWHEGRWQFMSVVDNGVGMRPPLPGSKSFGLIGIAERVYALGGAFDTESAPNRGTKLLVTIPWAGASADPVNRAADEQAC